MQTFLTCNSFATTALHLDDKRLGKQRVEVIQILNALRKPNYGWKNHPAVRMWAGYEWALCNYGVSMCLEWIRRGFMDTCLGKIDEISSQIYWSRNRTLMYPSWIADPRVHLSHQSNLVRKNPKHYRLVFPDIPDDLPYFWPTENEPFIIPPHHERQPP